MYFIIDIRYKKFNINFSDLKVFLISTVNIPNITIHFNHHLSSFNCYYDRKQLIRISYIRHQMSRKFNIET